MSNYKDLLRAAMTGEFNAIRKYSAFSKVAAEEGYVNIAKLFKALAEGEKIHLKNHKQALGEQFKPDVEEFTPGSTLENLRVAFNTETYEYKDMYPGFIRKLKRTKKEEEEVAKLSLRWAQDTERHHAEILKEAIECLEKGEDYHQNDFWVCEACGNLELGNAPDSVCPVCKHDPYFYKEVA